MATSSRVIDDLSKAATGANWQLIADTVMGGVSSGSITRGSLDGRNALRMQGTVSLENSGGFIQAALDLAQDGTPADASAYEGVELDAKGNEEIYNVHLRTADLRLPWQSYRHSFVAGRAWQTHRLPFKAFVAHRTDLALDPAKLRRIGIVAIGRAFEVDIAISGIRFYS